MKASCVTSSASLLFPSNRYETATACRWYRRISSSNASFCPFRACPTRTPSDGWPWLAEAGLRADWGSIGDDTVTVSAVREKIFAVGQWLPTGAAWRENDGKGADDRDQ